jgi:uncharacterized protein (TIGR04551 family)
LLGAAAFFASSQSAFAQSPQAPPPAAPPSGARPSLMPSAPPPSPGGAPSVSPATDQQQLAAQGQQRPADGTMPKSAGEVFSDDWWGHARPILELHGYFRTRGEVFHNFFLGRHDAPGASKNLWPAPLDQSYTDINGTTHNVALCGPQGTQNCYDKTQSTANLRLRFNPELHISDNLRIMSQIDMLDNLVMGSTPEAYATTPASGGTTTGYTSAGYNGYAPLGAFSTTQGPPTAGVNSWTNSVNVKRAWGEYQSPIGLFRFGRMPSHWGLGMLVNSGDGIDSDYQSTADRIMFVTGVKSLDLYFGGAWDMVSTGPTDATPYSIYGGQPANTCNLCNVDEWVGFVAHRTNADLQRRMLANGDLVLNGGLYTVYRKQLLDVQSGNTAQTVSTTTINNGLELRGAKALIPDLWLQLLWRKLRFEAELATIYGSIEGTPAGTSTTNPVSIRQYGLTTQTEYRAIEDKLRLQFGFGWASGDPWQSTLAPGNGQLQAELNNNQGPISTFRFHPDYRVDLIFFRHILSRVEGAYYFRPSVDYDFVRQPNGQKFGGGAAIIWSRASEFVQTPGHKRDLGVELDAQLYYQAKDGTLNDDPDKIGGFFAMIQYGVFFPLGGLDYLPGETGALTQQNIGPDLSTAQTLRLFLGVIF